jgi:hypothetical protein
MITDKRLGKFSIGRDFIHNNPGIVEDIMGKCIIVGARMKWETDAIHYVAISDLFEEMLDGQEPKIYHIEFVNEYDEAGKIVSIKWKFT